jgi:6-phosphogluconate dehydrogenase (decarboxylating)
MGRAIATRVALRKHELTLFDVDSAASEQLASETATQLALNFRAKSQLISPTRCIEATTG